MRAVEYGLLQALSHMKGIPVLVRFLYASYSLPKNWTSERSSPTIVSVP